MIHNGRELEATQERIAYFQRLLAQLRISATAEEFPAGGKRVSGRDCADARGGPGVLDAACERTDASGISNMPCLKLVLP